jgi:hypothetical protein
MTLQLFPRSTVLRTYQIFLNLEQLFSFKVIRQIFSIVKDIFRILLDTNQISQSYFVKIIKYKLVDYQ